MTAKFFALLTNQGAAKLANAAALGTKIQITQMGVGDGGGTLPTPTRAQTALVNEKRRAVLNGLSVDAANSSQIIAEQIIPENEGGFWIREIGLYDSDNTLIAVANCPETYKPMLAEGSGRTQTVRMILIINSTEAVTLKIDPAVVLATRQYVDDNTIEMKIFVTAALKETLLKNQNGADIPDTAQFVKNLGLGDGSALPVGIPVPYPLSTPPLGWLKCNGAAFSKNQYPKLALAYPTGFLPDLRGEFLRGWDDGRGVDGVLNRALLSWEPATLIVSAVGPDAAQQAVIEGGETNTATVAQYNSGLGTDFVNDNDYGSSFKGFTAAGAASSYPGNSAGANPDPYQSRPINANQYLLAGGARPRNIAFNYIVRAA
ncbi:phage tail protein [Rahnella sp. SAP-1]|uniref:Phage tail protein n=1 Tax=Rouxiella aceris TaxID=2703884 RepID=A0A848MIT7_9GAMM|nr:phage tail protein [Rouxiella aceris]NMP27216.1 phage tail protein [Rouxiella aceris]